MIGQPRDEADTVFDPDRIQTYRIEVPAAELARLDENPSSEEYTSANLTFGDEKYPGIGFRYKGSRGAFLAPCTASMNPALTSGPKLGKCSIKLAFDHFDDDGRFHGLKKVNLHSMGRDVSMLRERLAYDMFREMGVAAPRVAYARVEINGRLEGLFLAVEQIDGRFTRARFTEGGKGNLYKEVWPMYDDPNVYRAALESNKGDTTNVDKMLAFAAAVQRGPEAAWDWLDVDYTLRYIAVDRVLLNDDGAFHFYCTPQGNNPAFVSNHNYYWYEARDAGRLWLVPWDLDNTLDNVARVFIDVEWSALPDNCMCHVAVGFPQRAPGCDPLVATFATRRDQYEAYVDEFLAGPFAREKVDAQLAAWSEQIGPMVDEAAGLNGAPDFETWTRATDALRETIASARAHRGYDYGH